MEIILTIILILLILTLGVPVALVVIVAVIAVAQRTYRRIRVWRRRRRRRKPRWIIMVTEKCGDQTLNYLASGMDMVLGFKVPSGFATREKALECLYEVAARYGCEVKRNGSFRIWLGGKSWTRWRIEKV